MQDAQKLGEGRGGAGWREEMWLYLHLPDGRGQGDGPQPSLPAAKPHRFTQGLCCPLKEPWVSSVLTTQRAQLNTQF